MRLVIVSQHYWPETMPITHIARSLAAAGVEVRVVTGKPNYPDGAIFPGYRARGVTLEEHEGVFIHRVPLIPRGRGGALRLAANYLSFIVSGLLLGARAIPWARADAVLVFGTSPLIQAFVGIGIARAKRAKLVTWVQDLWPESLGATGFVRARVPLALVRAAVRAIYRRSDLVLVQSVAMLAPVRALAGITQVEPFLTPGGATMRGTSATSDRATDAPFDIVFAGNLGAAQALPTVLDAAERLRDTPEIRFVLVGSGRMAAWLTRQTADRCLGNVSIMGRVEQAAIPELLARADVLLLSLARDPALARTIPSKLADYLGVGKPVIAAVDGEAARIVIEAGAGLQVAAEDAAGLAAAARQLHAMSHAELAAIGARGRAYHARELASDVLIPRLIGRLHRLVAGATT